MGESGPESAATSWSGFTSRRNFLKAVGAAGALLGGGAVLSACNSDGPGGSSSDVTLNVSADGPYGPMPTKKEQKASIGSLAYAESLQAWLKKNPGVQFKKVSVNVWDQEAITTALTGGTAPAAFVSNVIGSWDAAGIRSAFLQGLAADVTEHVDESKLLPRLADYARPIWEKIWTVNGSYYAAPSSYNVGVGIHYRKDLVNELGLKMPAPGWTWADVRELAKGMTEGKRKGIALQSWGLQGGVSAEGLGLLSEIPAPETPWNWTWDYSSNVDHWARIIGEMRDMRFEDESVMADVTFGDGEIWNAFVRGDACMHMNTVVFYTAEPTADTTHMALAKKLDKPLEDVVGWAPPPTGRNGYRPDLSQGQIDAVSFSPDLDDDELSAIFDLHVYMIGEGFVKQKNMLYEETNDLKQVYNFDKITPVLKDTLDGMPGSPEEAWGTEFMEAVRAAGDHELMPNTAWYIPVEEQVGPTSEAVDDAFSKWWYERGDVDIAADLLRTESVRNTQAKSFTSSIADEEFTAGARKYYEAHDAFWQQNAPEFYDGVFRSWYEQKIRPALDA
ncbi:extracellular solute-binding protein [Actinopolymorpha sp. B17G11]|uniref:ABC transporter substrate-binding protein n=1 Tax=Actinopolymorpha sp. B17G11 TaxID=3160861 RepID=UPI0032E4E736